jgi:Xaa-Pro dipeptidase
MSNPRLYQHHLATLSSILEDVLTRAGKHGTSLDGLLFHAGRATSYHRDDQEVAFRAAPHFLRYVPLNGPEHVVLAKPGKKPLLVRVAPKDFWYEVAPPPLSYWQEAIDMVEVDDFSQVHKAVGPIARIAYIGNSKAAAAELGMPPELVEPDAVLKPLDWHRAKKTDHEIALIDVAAERAAAGHRRAHEKFTAGASEKEIHWAYLEATGHLERDVPFETIVAYDDKTAILHYQNKRDEIRTARHTFMLDAGATTDGYASDITRTWLKPSADPTFKALLDGLDAFQRDLVAMVTVGRPYPEIHFAAHDRVAKVLCDTKIARCSPAEAVDKGVTRVFLPHGVGHHLGLQVHDVGGHQTGPDGGVSPPPKEHRTLRNTRTLEAGHVVTIEPGIYFIPMLLKEARAGGVKDLINWPLVDRLTPFGGMRIEDDVVCTPAGPKDLTRGKVAGPRDT